MQRLSSIGKNKLKNLISLLPYGRDLYLVFTRNRRGISYRGIFDSYDMALKAVPPKRNTDYDVINAGKAANLENEKAGLDSWFHDIDYPLLFWLAKILNEKNTVLELGGSVGHFFIRSKNYVISLFLIT